MNVLLGVVENQLLSHVELRLGRIEALAADLIGASAGDSLGLAGIVALLTLGSTNLEFGSLEFGQRVVGHVAVG